MPMNRLADILKEVRNRYPKLAKRIQESEALNRWEKAVGPAIAKHSRAFRVQDGILWVEVDHPIWKSELHYRKNQIIAQLNAAASAQDKPILDILLLDPRKSPNF